MLNCKVILDAIQIKPGLTQKESLSLSFKGKERALTQGLVQGLLSTQDSMETIFFFNFYWLSLVFVAHDSFIFNVFFLNKFIWVKKK